jgi:uncharacterized protein
MTMYIIDRTKNSSGKSLPIKQRFYERARRQIQDNINQLIKSENIKDLATGKGNKIVMRASDLSEPSFHFDNDKSDWTRVFPGNPDTPDQALIGFEPGDKLSKPQGGGSGGTGSGTGSSIDDFIFSLSEEDWTKYLFDQLRLPNQDETKAVKSLPIWKKRGFTSTGMPANLSLIRTMRNSIGRRIGLGRPKDEIIEQLQLAYDNATDEDKPTALLELEEQQNRRIVIPWIDPIDVKYYNHVKEMEPKMNAVMFCLMDVSASMSEHMKDLAKRFYVYLYKFLKSKYKGNVDVVFIRHTHVAEEVDEQTFFYDPESGGTIVSTALEKMLEIVKERYPLDQWNIYGAQASDGDKGYGSDEANLGKLITQILDISQFYVYLEINRSKFTYTSVWENEFSDLWKAYDKLRNIYPKKFVMTKINDKKEIWKTMVEIFGK